ncbi:hypothetical protein ES703_60740 [subsurface metagenome]
MISGSPDWWAIVTSTVSRGSIESATVNVAVCPSGTVTDSGFSKNRTAPLAPSYAPMSTIGGVPFPVSGMFGSSANRGSPSRSIRGRGCTPGVLASVSASLLPASMQGEPDNKRRLSSSVPILLSSPSGSKNRGSLVILPGSQLSVQSRPIQTSFWSPWTSLYEIVRSEFCFSAIWGPLGALFPHRMQLASVGLLSCSLSIPPP